jgi:hypothetical protein
MRFTDRRRVRFNHVVLFVVLFRIASWARSSGEPGQEHALQYQITLICTVANLLAPEPEAARSGGSGAYGVPPFG